MINSTTSSTRTAEKLITENIDVWTSAIKKRGSQGRGSSKKIELYGIKKLRELILELAVRGLLVPQDPSDEPASVLLEKIVFEKERLVKEGKIKKQNPLLPICDEEKPFGLPKGWEFIRLGALVVLRSGVTFPKDRELEIGGYPFCKVGDMNLIDNSTELTTSSRFIDPLEKEIHQLIPSNSIVFPKRGGAIATNKKRYVNKPLFVDLNVMAATPIGGMSLRYLMTWLERIDLASLNTGTSVPQINNKDIYPLVFPIPPESEQPRIVAKVDELMALCDQLEQQTETSLTAHQILVETLLNTLLNAAQTSSALSSVSGQTTTSPASSKVPETKESDLTAKEGGNEGITNLQDVDGRTESGTIRRAENSFEAAWNRIAEHFDILFTTEHSIDQLKQTILQLAVMGKLVPQDSSDEPASVLLEKIAAEKEQLIKDKKIKKQKPVEPIGDLKELPTSWKNIVVQDFADIRLGSTPNRAEAEYWNGEIPWVSSGEVIQEVITSTAEAITEAGFKNSSTSLIPARSLLMAIIGQGKTRGQTALLGIEACTNQNVAAFVFSEKYVVPEFVWIWAQSKYDSHREGGHGGAQPALNGKKVRSFRFPLPPFNEQNRIVSKVDELMALCEVLKSRIGDSEIIQFYLTDAITKQALSKGVHSG